MIEEKEGNDAREHSMIADFAISGYVPGIHATTKLPGSDILLEMTSDIIASMVFNNPPTIADR